MKTLLLQVLGVTIRVDCLYDSCAEEVLAHMSGHILSQAKYESPDIWLEFTGKHFDRYFYRERPESLSDTPLENVRYYTEMSGESASWTSNLPPLVPYGHETNLGRFVALHAGCVALDVNAVVLLVGERGAGKTTLCRELCSENNGTLLTDEAVFLHRRTRIAEPLTLSMGIFTDGISKPKSLIPANKVCKKLAEDPQIVTHLVILEKSDHNAIKAVESSSAFSLLMPHNITVGSNWKETVTTYARMVNEIPTYQICWKDYKEFGALADSLMCKILSRK